MVVLRDGRLVGRLGREEITPAAMIRLMIGRDLKAIYRPPAAPPGEPLLEIEGAETAAHPGRQADLVVRRGEILGLAGLIGAGRTELARAVFGIEPLKAGTVRLDGRAVAVGSPRTAIGEGIYLVPEDRKACGVVLDFSVAENVSLPQLRGAGAARAGRPRGRGGARRGGAAAARHPGAGRRDHGRDALGRQPAEGGAGEVAGDAAAGDHLRRADARHRRRRQARDL